MEPSQRGKVKGGEGKVRRGGTERTRVLKDKERGKAGEREGNEKDEEREGE